MSSAIGNHDEGTGTAIDVVSAALILADKTDVRRNRVRNQVIASFDAHDRVNYAALSVKLSVDREKKVIQMDMDLDDTMCTVMDYFEIFLQRMMMCRRAAEVLGCKFKLTANGSKCETERKYHLVKAFYLFLPKERNVLKMGMSRVLLKSSDKIRRENG